MHIKEAFDNVTGCSFDKIVLFFFQGLIKYFNDLSHWYPYQVDETDEARKKFSNAKSISSAQFFGVQNKDKDLESSISLQKFSVCRVLVYPLFHIPIVFISLSVFGRRWGIIVFCLLLPKLHCLGFSVHFAIFM